MRKKKRVYHGMSGGHFYEKYYNILSRCNNPKCGGFYKYGGRGIKVLWKDFTEFKNDMYKSYLKHVAKHGEKETTIDRIDPKGHYSGTNCRWATFNEQAGNRINHHIIEYKGEVTYLNEWARRTGLDRRCISRRIKRGWSIEEALTTPVITK